MRIKIMKFFAQKKIVAAETEAKLNPVQLTEGELDQVSGGSGEYAPIGVLIGLPNSGAAQATANKHHPGASGLSFSGLHLMGI